jgi:hypothetical protein
VFESARLAIANGRLSRAEYDAWQHDYKTGVSESIHCEFDDQKKAACVECFDGITRAWWLSGKNNLLDISRMTAWLDPGSAPTSDDCHTNFTLITT